MLDGINFALIDALLVVVLFVFLRLLLRKDWLAGAVWGLLVTAALCASAETPAVFVPVAAIAVAALLWAITRFGLVSAVVGMSVHYYFWNYPMTFAPTQWYSGIGYMALVVVAAITLYGFQTSLGGRRLGLVSSDDELNSRRAL